MLSIIPARGGSKGLPGKNIRPLCGIPLIAYTLDAALKSKAVDRVIVSTDDDRIAQIAKRYGAEIPFLRPKKLAQDSSLAIDNYIYTLDRINAENSIQYDEFVVLQPTSPLRTAADIDDAARLFREKNADSVISVCQAPHPPQWAKKVDSSGLLKNYYGMHTGDKNRQDLVPAFVPNGAIFILKLSIIKFHRSYYTDKTYAFIMARERSVDIDSSMDFEFAEFLMHRNALRNA
jgi:N-acylneuraminate cytidylyltransferase/CMP-N,N'-diacetyllegionaminic acid synthase